MKKTNLDKNKERKERTYLINSPDSFDGVYDSYCDALNSVIKKPNVLNIGIVGTYCSGKSSLVETFLKKHNGIKKKTCKISLATFSKETIDDEKEKNKIEKSILEQIIYKRSYDFKSKSNISRIKGKIISTLLVATSFIALASFICLAIMAYVNSEPLVRQNSFFVFFALADVFGVLTVFSLLHVIKISKLSVPNVEIEFDSEKRGSILNQFIDEVINFCVETKTEYFVFEDIDRFNCIDLLQKLREINFLINYNEAIKKSKKKVVFIYCVKDGIFESSEDRAKFFDFVISPAPILNPDNSRQFIEKGIEDNHDKDLKISETDLIEMSFFIKEKRVLNNIFNDYLFYKDNLPAFDSKDNYKLFAMMIYKNLSFADFTKLQSNDGLLYKIFNEYKTKAIEQLLRGCSKEIKDIQDKIEKERNRDHSKEFDELRLEISGLIVEEGVETNYYDSANFSNNKAIKTYKDVKNFLFVGLSYNKIKYISLSNIINRFGRHPYEIEKDIFEHDLSLLSNDLKKKMDELAFARRLSASELILKGLYDQEIVDEIKKDSFLYFAIVNGYIDENYFRFSGRPDADLDNDFIKDVLSGAPIEIDRPVRNPDLAISRLSVNRFFSSSILNYYVVDALLKQNVKNNKKRDALIEYLCERKDETILFIGSYAVNGEMLDAIINGFYEKGYCDVALDVEKHYGANNREVSMLISKIILLNSNQKLYISFFNRNGGIKNAIEKCEKSVVTYSCLFEKAEDYLNFLDEIGVKEIKHLDDIRNEDDKKICHIVSELAFKGMFSVNSYNISIISKKVFNQKEVTLSHFIKNKNKGLSEHCLSNLQGIVESVLKLSNSLKDTQETIQIILTSDSVDGMTKIKYVKCLRDKIDYVKGLSISLIVSLLNSNKLVSKFSNLDEIRKVNEVPFEYIVDFVKTNIASFQDKITETLFVDLINDDSFASDYVTRLCGYLTKTIAMEKINDDNKRRLVIKNKKISIDSSALAKCKGMKKSLVALLNANPLLVKDLPSGVSSNEEYYGLFACQGLDGEAKKVIALIYHNKMFPLFKEKDFDVLNSLIVRDGQNADFDYSFADDYLSFCESETIRREFVKSLETRFTDSELLELVKKHDQELFAKLNSKPGKVAIDLEIAKTNYFYKMLEKRKIVRTTNPRTYQCNAELINKV